jgi:ABC-type bacteriocin/lantibiotic exporter with double-glycine peptidase domain
MQTFREWLMLREDVIKAHVPTGSQERMFSCGAAALKLVFQYFKVGPQSEAEIRKLVKSSANTGTRTQNIIAACREHGLKTKARYNMDRHELEGVA